MKRLFQTVAGFSFWFALSASAAVFTSDTTIPSGNTNFDGDDIEVIGCTVTIDGPHSFSDMFIIANGVIAHSPATNSADVGLALTISNYLVIEAGSGIVVDGLGYGPGSGPGAGQTVTNSIPFGFPLASGGGGAYGGNGAASIGGAKGGIAYGSLLSPTNAGSGGGAGVESAPGGAGGGIVRLKIGGALIMDGRISADGAHGLSDASGGGSGGSIYITSPMISGAGTISADGGTGESSNGGAGAGGLVTVSFTSNDFSGSISAHGGDGAMRGGAGIIYSIGSKSTASLVLVDNGGLSGTNTPINPPTANLTVRGGAIARIANSAIVGNLVIESNSWVTTFLGINIRANNVTVEAGGGFNLNGGGPNTDGPGEGSVGQVGGGFFGGGGGHGGPGGNGFAGAGGGTFDSATAPTMVGGTGAPGGVPGTTVPGGGGGGGTLQLQVAQTLTLNGIITANGGKASSQNSGGGAGGSIHLTATTFTGNGSITANGGNAGSADGGGGGGGRIALNYLTNTYYGTIAAHGGTGYQNGGPGTIYATAGPAVHPQMTIDNAGLEGPPTLLPLGQGNVILTNAASATLTENLQSENIYISSNCYLICSNLNTIFAQNLVIEPNGGLVADGVVMNNKLPQSGAGFTYATGGTSGGGGAGEGFGGNSALGAAGGSPTLPQEPNNFSSGTGGGNGGGGGGNLQVQIAGSALVNGRISANGGAGSGVGSGGGGGGTVNLTVGSLAGDGILCANGGVSQLLLGGGGGGGTVNLTVNQTNLFAGTIAAYGGDGATVGGAGMIVLRTNQGVAQVIVDNNGRAGTNTLFTSPDGGLFDLNVLNGAVGQVPGLLSDCRNVLVGSNAVLTLATNNLVLIELRFLGNLTVQAGGVITVDGNGSAPTLGHAPGGAGGSHGGLGGSGAGGPTSPANSENVQEPTFPGLGGQDPPGIPPTGGRGGGPLLLTCGFLTLDGKISANGQPGISEGCGGGAGGSILIQASAISGNGSITANGGEGNSPEGGGGGGGRIALHTITNMFTGTISAAGGPGFNPGGAGTISTQFGTAQDTLVIDNAGNSNGYTQFPQVGNLNAVVLTGNAIVLVSNIISPGSLILQSNSFLISTNTLPTMTIEATGNVTIAAGCGISCDTVSRVQNGLGGSYTTLPNGGRAGGGGANAGNGGSGQGGAAGGIAPNESIIQPGSDGGAGGNGLLDMDQAPPALGGGSLSLSVKGILKNDGVITANGADATNEWGGGGAGGSVNVFATSLSGTGKITADGGSGNLPSGGGGGGGRVALSVATNSFSGSISAFGGEGFVAGGAGAVYMAIQGLPPELIIDNGGLLGAATPLYESIPTNVDLIVTNGAIMLPRAALSLGSLFVESNAFISQLSNHFQITVSGNAQVGPTAGISADGGGWSADSGPGTGTTASNYTSSGGGYGGVGGLSEGGALGGETNGFLEAPTNWGSGGGVWFGPAALSQGGGAITLNVGGTLTLNGDISANGNNGVYPGSGGGAGGSIWLTVGTLAGNGLIAADGGASQNTTGGGGGGGRIAVYSTENEFAGSIRVNGGSGFNMGSVGSIFITTNKTVTQVEGTPIPGLEISQPVSSASMTLSWIGKTGVLYQVQSSDDLIHWRPFGEVVLSGTGSTQATLTPAPNSQQQYFRLVIVN